MKLSSYKVCVIFFISALILSGSNSVVLAINSPFGQSQIALPQSSDSSIDETAYDEEEVIIDDQTDDSNLESELASSTLEADSVTFIELTEYLRKMVIRENFEKPKSNVETEDNNEHYLDAFSNIDVDIDGDNYCGQFAMTTVLNGYGIEADGNDIYKQSNPAGIFTAPPVIVETLIDNGINASKKHDASIKDITERIDDGKPVMLLVDSGGGVPHWICVVGYDTDSKGNVTSIRMRDSYWGTNKPFDMDIEKFTAAWENPLGSEILGQIAKYKNVLIDIDGKSDGTTSSPLYPSNFETATEDNIGGALNDVVTGWKNGDVPKVCGGAAKILLGLPSAIVGVASNYVSSKSEQLIAAGKAEVEKGGFLNKLKGGAAIASGNILKDVCSIGKTIANAGSSIANVTGNAIKKLGSLFS